MRRISFFDNTAQIYVIGIDDFIKPDNLDLSYYLSFLSKIEKERFNRYKNINAQFTFLTARYYLRKLLNNNNIVIETTSTGKPYLKDYPTLFFNISHTDSLILIAFSHLPIGVDVEKISRNADRDAIVKHFFSEKEQQSYFSQPEPKRQLAFVRGWTRKEAILKATGEGLSALNNYEVSFEPETDYPLLDKIAYSKFKIKDFIPNDGYVGCLALIS